MLPESAVRMKGWGVHLQMQVGRGGAEVDQGGKGCLPAIGVVGVWGADVWSSDIKRVIPVARRQQGIDPYIHIWRGM